jgi:hypothetical protein
VPVRVKKTREDKKLEPGSDITRTEMALVGRHAQVCLKPAASGIIDPKPGRSIPRYVDNEQLIVAADMFPEKVPNLLWPAIGLDEPR